VALGAVAALSTQGCATDTEPSPCDGEVVEAFKELVVVDEDVLADARTKNGAAGPWSFRHAVEQMAPGDPSEFVRTWLESWINLRELNSFPLDRPLESRAETLTTRILCPSYQATPENACDETCTRCTGTKLDLAKAPFRLIAITNRIDQRDEVAVEQNGEGRFVFALTKGPADDAASEPLAMTVIFEYHLATTRSTREWAETWHALGKIPGTGEEYRTALEGVTNAYSKRGSRPEGVNGSAIAQIRTNESYLNWIWQQREFGLGTDGLLHLQPTRNTPGEALNNPPQLATWLNDNRTAIMKGRYEIPGSMRSGSSDALQYRWTIPGVDDTTRLAFARGTCNGCHTTEHPSLDTAFHVSPFRKGKDKLSLFLFDPNGGNDDIKARTASMRRALCSK
jgi:hypothetical protein